MTIDALLSRLDGVREVRHGRWMARCPAHDDRHASLSIRDVGDGRILINDFGGCETHQVLQSVGLTFADLFPRRLDAPEGFKRERRPFDAVSVLHGISHEATVVAMLACDMIEGVPPTVATITRLITACGRIHAGLSTVGDGIAPQTLRRLRRC